MEKCGKRRKQQKTSETTENVGNNRKRRKQRKTSETTENVGKQQKTSETSELELVEIWYMTKTGKDRGPGTGLGPNRDGRRVGLKFIYNFHQIRIKTG